MWHSWPCLHSVGNIQFSTLYFDYVGHNFLVTIFLPIFVQFSINSWKKTMHRKLFCPIWNKKLPLFEINFFNYLSTKICLCFFSMYMQIWDKFHYHPVQYPFCPRFNLLLLFFFFRLSSLHVATSFLVLVMDIDPSCQTSLLLPPPHMLFFHF